MPIPDDVLLVHGDCFDVMPKIPAGSVDMVFCDIPYAHKTSSGATSSCTSNFWDTPIDINGLWNAIKHAGAKSCVYLFMATQPFATAVMNSATVRFSHDLVWDKKSCGSFAVAKRRPLPYHEGIYIFGNNFTYNPQMTKKDRVMVVTPGRCQARHSVTGMTNKGLLGKIYTHSYPRSIQVFTSRDKYRGLHPTQKPVALLEWLIRTYTNPGDLVLDPCSGSGTTAIAAFNTGRRAICIEKDATYHAAAVKRLADARRAPKQASLVL